MTTSCLDALNVLLLPGSVAELRILNAGPKGTISGYFDDVSKMAAAAARWNGRVPAVYTTLNPVIPDLLARANNRVIEKARATTTDKDIVKRVWLPIDFDVTRPAGISSTAEEHDAALAVAQRCRQFLRDLGWPDPIYADSGNGAHLDYRIDLPTESTLVQRVLEFLAGKFDSGRVHVDTGMFNPARIWKLYGTKVCKGDSTPERPHRVSSILECPAPLTIVRVSQIEQLLAAGADKSKPETNPRPYEARAFDLDAWLAKYQHRLPPLGMKRPFDGAGWKREFDYCPWNADHTNNSAFIGQGSRGVVAACQHHSCQHKTWHDLKALVGDTVTGQAGRWSSTTAGGRDATEEKSKANGRAQAEQPNPDDWRQLFHTYEETINAPPITFAIDGFLQEQGITIIGGLAGHGKTLVMLAMAQTLLEGGKLFTKFRATRQAKRVLYLIPECALSPFAARLKTFHLEQYVGNQLFYRTLSKDEIQLSLLDLRLLKAAEGADVFLDTAIRFMEGDENANSEQRIFAQTLFKLVHAGAHTVTGAHHSPKSASNENFMSLQNVLRGASDIGAMLTCCWGLRQIDSAQNKIYIENVKPRDFQACEPFIIQGRPSLDQTGYFEMTDPPGFAGKLCDHADRKGGRPKVSHECPDKVAEAWRMKLAGASIRDIASKLGLSKSVVGRWFQDDEEIQ